VIWDTAEITTKTKVLESFPVPARHSG
jgi:hypothetical protein